MQKIRIVAGLLGWVLVSGCSTMMPASSFTLLSNNAGKPYKALTAQPVSESVCQQMALIVMFGDMAPSHEQLVATMLEKHDAEVLLNAEMSTTTLGFPLLYFRHCVNVTGIPARRASYVSNVPAKKGARK
ncbi:MAG: hypothetical protein JNL01_06740 [Bdellovibrionales bacterium]|nr:hypothetical protein [Bdellovibrionales bacterium]